MAIAVPTKKARELAREAREKIKNGIDPIAEKAEAKAKETAASGTESNAAKCEKDAKVEPEEVLPVGSAVCFLVSPNTGWVHLVHPDGTRISRGDGSALYFQWEALAHDSEPTGWLAPGTALRVRVDECVPTRYCSLSWRR